MLLPSHAADNPFTGPELVKFTLTVRNGPGAFRCGHTHKRLPDRVTEPAGGENAKNIAQRPFGRNLGP